MRRIKFITSSFILLFVITLGCEDSPLDNEQYIKQAYLVGADETSNMGMSTVEVSYSDSEQEIFISVATGGSLNIDRDIEILIEEAGNDAIDSYNSRYLSDDDIHYQKLDSSFYRIPDFNVQINSGEVYGNMLVYINTSGLHCDSLYSLTFKIKSVSDSNYIAVRKADTVLIQSFSFINDYSETYQSDGYYYRWEDGAVSDSTALSTTREFTAVDLNTVRFYHLANTESTENIDTYGVSLTITNDNNVSVNSWGSLEITDGGGTYNPDIKTFTIWYNYMSGNTEYQFSGKFVRDDS